jgi:hypothetical protein
VVLPVARRGHRLLPQCKRLQGRGAGPGRGTMLAKFSPNGVLIIIYERRFKKFSLVFSQKRSGINFDNS